jgi:fatty aldehyde-generating acyl-ACP reductase
MDSSSPCLDFAVIGHQDSWQNIAGLVNGIRTAEQEKLSVEKIKNIFSFIPPRDLFRINLRSTTGAEINGVYIDTFIDPDKLDTAFTKSNISKVMKAVSCAKRMSAKITTLGGFTSIVLEGNLDAFSTDDTKFTTGNTLTAAYVVKGIEKAASQHQIDLSGSTILIVGATGDIGMACVNYLKKKCRKLLLCARNNKQLEKLSQELIKENISVNYSISLQQLIPEADIIICVASSTGIKLADCKKNVLICDAGYPKNLDLPMEHDLGLHVFHGGMGQVSQGLTFSPDYSNHIYRYAAPNVVHGCILEAMILAFENKFEPYSAGKGNITVERMEEIYAAGLKHGITLAPFYNARGLWKG